MGKKENKPRGNEADAIGAAQEQAMKAVYEQAQALFGAVPGFEMPGMEDIQAQIEAQMRAAVPDLDEIRAQQAAMGAPGGMPAGMTIPEGTAQQYMDIANQYAAAMGGFTADGRTDDDWEIERTGDGQLTPGQLRLLAFGAPLFVYNGEAVDSYDSEYDADITREQMNDWWGITDRATTLGTVRWLLEEGHHAEADEVLQQLHAGGREALRPEGKVEDVLRIAEMMLREGYCTAEQLPRTVLAWDLVRVVNVGRWTYHCGYISSEEMWDIMQTAVRMALQHFSSWEEYGRSFVLGRGVWHGEPDDCTTAQEIVTALLTREESPWKQIPWQE